MFKYFVYALSILFFTACGDGYAGGPDDTPPEHIHVSSEEGTDILYKYQWHLENRGSNSFTASTAVAGNDINVKDVWSDYTGKGVTVAIIDEGVEIGHPDLKKNIDKSRCWNYLTRSRDTTPKNPYSSHGTAVAGIVAAVANNGIGGRGVAPDAALVSFNMLESQNLVNWNLGLESLVRGIDDSSIDIYNNSWGFPAGTIYPNYDSLSSLYYQFANQLHYGIIHGREGKGAIYVKSSGNDRIKTDDDNIIRPYWNANLSPIQTERYLIVVAASMADGRYSDYSTLGSNVLVNAPGGWIHLPFLKVDKHLIVTTDLTGKHRGADRVHRGQFEYHFAAKGNENYDYTDRMNGTSAAGPIVSGVAALMLEANPDLSWRDVRYILATTATKNGSGYIENAAGHSFSNTYGFGRVDAKSAVEKSIGWDGLGAEISYVTYFPYSVSKTDLHDENLSKSESAVVVSSSNISHIEYINFEISIAEVEEDSDTKGAMPNSSQLRIVLYSPSGTASELLYAPNGIDNSAEFFKTRFGSNAFLDEKADGIWTIKVEETRNYKGKKDPEGLTSFVAKNMRLEIYGR